MTVVRKLTGTLALMRVVATPAARAQADNPAGIAVSLVYGISSIEDEDAPGDTFDGSDVGWSIDAEWRFVEDAGIGFAVLSLGEDSDEGGEERSYSRHREERSSSGHREERSSSGHREERSSSRHREERSDAAISPTAR